MSRLRQKIAAVCGVADAIRTRASVLVVPGGMMGSEGHLRLSVGFEPEFLGAALERMAGVLESL